MQILYLLCIIGILVPALSSTFDEPDFSDENSSDSSVRDYVLEISEYDVADISELRHYLLSFPVIEPKIDYSYAVLSNHGEASEVLEKHSNQVYKYFDQLDEIRKVHDQNFFRSNFLNPQLPEFEYEIISSQLYQGHFDSNNISEIIFPAAGLDAEYSYNPHPLYGLLEIEISQAIIESVQGQSLQEEKTENQHHLSTLSELLGSRVSTKSTQEESHEIKDINVRHVKDGDNKFEKRKEETLQVDKTSKSGGNKLQNAETSDDSLNESQVNSLSRLSGSYVNTMLTEEHPIQKKTSIINIQIIDEEFELTNRKDETSQEYNSSNAEENNLQKVKFLEGTNNKRHLSPILELLRPQNSTESVQEGTIQGKEYLKSKHISHKKCQFKKEKNKSCQLHKVSKSKEKTLQNAKALKETNYDAQIKPLSKLSESQVNVEKSQRHSVQKKDTDNNYQLNALSELSGPQSSTEASQDESIKKKENRNIKQANAEGYELRKNNNKIKQINQTTKSVENKLRNAEASENSNPKISNDPQLNPLSELSKSLVHTLLTQKHRIQKTEDISNINGEKYEFTKVNEEITEIRKSSQSEVLKLQSI